MARAAHLLTSDQAVTLQHVREITAYNDWIFDTFARFVHGRVVEAGCGIGTYTGRLAPVASDLLCIDFDRPFALGVRRQFPSGSGVRVVVAELGPRFELAPGSADTIVALNVVEHIADDDALLRQFHRWLEPGGHAVVQVPAHAWLYGSVDAALGHFRRYTRASLAAALDRAGLELAMPPRYLYALAVPGWWAVGRLRRRSVVSARSARLANLAARLSRGIERRFAPPFGITVLAVGRRPRQVG